MSARPRYLVIDAGLAAIVYALSVFPRLWGSHHLSDWPVVVGLNAVTAIPLVWRRRFPIPVTVIVGVGTVSLVAVHELPRLPYAQLLATYTFAALSGPVTRLVGIAGTVVGISVSVVMDTDPVTAAGVSGMTFSMAYALGTGTRARRDRITMLEERAARLAEERAGAAAAERERIARDMHDILVHSVSLIVVQAEAGATVVHDSPDRAQAAFDAISSAGREALAQLRGTLATLRGPASRAPQPDLDALPALVDGARRAGLDAALEETGSRRAVPADLAVAAYRIVQEALTNTIRHAAARQVRVCLRWLPGAVRIEVTDDGRGAADPPGAGGHGLVGMRERAAACGGELTTGPGPGGAGFRVTATLPVAG